MLPTSDMLLPKSSHISCLLSSSILIPRSARMSETEKDVEVSASPEDSIRHGDSVPYIDPELAVTIDEVKERRRSYNDTSAFSAGQVTYINPDSNPASSTYRLESAESWVAVRRSRGRSPVSSRRRRSSPYGRTASSATSLSEDSPMRRFKGERGTDSDLGVSRSPCDIQMAHI